jgi:hypothetical protein
MGSAWWRGKALSVPQVTPRSVYDLAELKRGSVVVVAAPGPSFASFPVEELRIRTTIGVNALPELFLPDYWIWQEKTFARLYFDLYSTGKIRRVVTTRKREFLGRLMPEGSELYCFQYQDVALKKYCREPGRPGWFYPEREFLPGHASISSNALSLAVLMNPRLVVVVGVDFSYSGDGYYSPGVNLNRGPKVHNRARALESGAKWMSEAAQRRIWAGPRIITTSPTLDIWGIERLSVDQALAAMREVEK